MPQSLLELRERVNAIHKILNDSLNVYNNLNPYRQSQLVTGINKAYGQAMGFQHEYLTTGDALGKGRFVETQVNGDVTMGLADQLFAKTVECKSVTVPGNGPVNTAIEKAIEQLGGQTGHMPREGDVRVVDIKIDGGDNPWPLPGGEYGLSRENATLGDIIKSGLAILNDIIIRSNKPGAMAIRDWLMGQNYMGLDKKGPLGQLNNSKSTRPVFVDHIGITRKIRCLTIKVRYGEPYWLIEETMSSQLNGVVELVVQVYKNEYRNELQLEIVKVKRNIFDSNSYAESTKYDYHF